MKLKWLKEMGSEYGHSYFIPPFLFSYKTKIRKEACPYEVYNKSFFIVHK